MKSTIFLTSLVGSVVLLASCSSSPDRSVESAAGEASAAAVADSSGSTAGEWPYAEGELLGGTATPTFPEGEPGEVSVVQIGPYDGSLLPFAYRNNTDAPISDTSWSGTARSGGQIVATGSSQGVTPSHLAPGEVGLAFIYFGPDAEIPADAEFEFTESHSPADPIDYGPSPFVVTETNNVGNAIVGEALNRTGSTVGGPYSVHVYCFDGDNLVGAEIAYAEQMGDIEDGGNVTFTVDLFDSACPSYLVGVSGYFNPS